MTLCVDGLRRSEGGVIKIFPKVSECGVGMERLRGMTES